MIRNHIKKSVYSFVVLVAVFSPTVALPADSKVVPFEILNTSRRIATLASAWQSGNRAALREFWADVTKHGAPLVEDFPADRTYVIVTFLWRGRGDTQNVYLFSTALKTATLDAPVTIGNLYHEMIRLPDSDLWYLPIRVLKSSHFTYSFVLNGVAEVNRKAGTNVASRIRGEGPLLDPLNPKAMCDHQTYPGMPTTDDVSSLLDLRTNNENHWNEPELAGKLELQSEQFHSKLLNNDRRIWIYTPPNYSKMSAAPDLLFLFDGPVYITEIPVPVILENMMKHKLIRPTVAVFIDDPLNGIGRDELKMYTPTAEFMAKEIIPWVREHWNVTKDPKRTTIAGYSAGGLEAGWVAFLHPEIFGNVLSESGAYWRGPYEGDQTRGSNPGWWEGMLHEVKTKPKVPARFHLDAGLFETDALTEGGPSLLTANRHLRDALLAKGYFVDYRETESDHEIVNWRSTFAESLLSLSSNNRHSH